MKLLSVAEICPDHTALGLTSDLEGWNSDHGLFKSLVHKIQPQVYIEVGSWKGRGALHVAELTKEYGTKIYCVDTWLGEVNLTGKNRESADLAPCQYDHDAIYNQFLHNVGASGFADRIYPVPHTSMAAAHLLGFLGIKGDMVYIDADHSYRGAYADLEYYACLVSEKGVFFGDDFRDFPGVRAAVTRFAFENCLRVAVNGPAWILQPME